ncbi:alpha/beta fold hydrolase [Ferrovibrio sp.]|uniref:alpha/beta fold hydrolase n=1 Tax=Ferrovibrio sp. TaxID=1917215 RepID=UPI00311DC738
MHVTEAGRGRPLIFLHGWSCHGGFFAPQAAGLRDRFHLLFPDLPGHRNSPARTGDLSIGFMADALHRVIAERGLQNAVLVGWSMGALVAFDYIARHGSAALGGLVIADMTPKITNDTGWSLGIRGGFDMAQSMAAVLAMQADWPAYAGAFVPRIFARSGCHDPALQDWAAAQILYNDPGAMAALWASMAACDYRPLMPRLDMPVLILHGGESQLYDPAVSLWLEAEIPAARRHCLAAAGHAPHLEMPAAFNAALSDFVS